MKSFDLLWSNCNKLLFVQISFIFCFNECFLKPIVAKSELRLSKVQVKLNICYAHSSLE